MYFATLRPAENSVPSALAHVVAVPRERDLLPRRLLRELLERLAADELVVELHERAVAQVVRREVIVLDLLRDEAAAERRHRLVARCPRATRGSPLHLRRRCRRPAAATESSPTRACSWDRCARRRCRDAELRAGLEQRVAHGLALVPRPEQLPAGLARPCRGAARGPCGRRSSTVLMLKNLMSGIGLPVAFAMTFGGVRALHLVAVRPCAPALVHERALVALAVGVVAAGLDVELHPVQRGRTADEVELVRREVKQDRVADDVAVMVARDELLRRVDAEVVERVDAEIGEAP